MPKNLNNIKCGRLVKLRDKAEKVKWRAEDGLKKYRTSLEDDTTPEWLTPKEKTAAKRAKTRLKKAQTNYSKIFNVAWNCDPDRPDRKPV